MNKVLITGATGLVGTMFCQMLQAQGIEPIILGRNAAKSSKYRIFEWNLQKDYVDKQLFLEKIDAVVHLAGAGIADKRWTAARKKEIIDSRVKGIELLTRYFADMEQEQRPKVFISASAVGIYGDKGEDWVDESTALPPKGGNDFLVESCLQWEEASLGLEAIGLRRAVLRIGIVLSTQGGALSKMLPSYPWGIGTYFGQGQQYYSWVHIEDLCRMLLFLLQEPQAKGIYNGVAPEPISNKALAKSIAKALNKKVVLMPVPTMALNLAMGEMSRIVTDSTRVSAKRLQEAGFEYHFPQIVPALEDLITRKI